MKTGVLYSRSYVLVSLSINDPILQRDFSYSWVSARYLPFLPGLQIRADYTKKMKSTDRQTKQIATAVRLYALKLCRVIDRFLARDRNR